MLNGFADIVGSAIFIVASLYAVLVVADPYFNEFKDKSGVVASWASWMACVKILGGLEALSEDCFLD